MALVAVLSGCEQARWQSQLASVNAAGTDSGDQRSWDPVLAPDGTKVVFSSNASNLGPIDTHPSKDIYVRDLTTGVTELVSANAAGTNSGNGESRYAIEFSPDGTKVLFVSDATDLASPAPDAHQQLYMRDLTTDTTTLISVNADGTGGGSSDAIGGDFSPDGTKVLFSSGASNIAGGSGGVFERDLVEGVTTWLAAGCCATYSPSGDAIAFHDQSGVGLRDAATGALTSVSVGRPGYANGYLGFSHDGNKVALSFETNVSSGLRTDIYVYDRTTRTTTLATPAVIGGGGSNGYRTSVAGFHPSDSNKLLFSSEATNLVTNDTDSIEDVFIRDLAKRTTALVSMKADGSGGGGGTRARWVGDGSKVAFITGSQSLGPHDSNQGWDVYLRDLTAGTYTLVSTNAAGDDAGNRESGHHVRPITYGEVFELSVSADGTTIAFGSEADDLGPTDSDRPGDYYMEHDIYVASLVTPPSS